MALRVDTICRVEARDDDITVFRIDVAKNETGVLDEYFTNRLVLKDGEIDKAVFEGDWLKIERFFLETDRACQIKLVPEGGTLAATPAIKLIANQALFLPGKLAGVYVTSLGGVTTINAAGFGRDS